MSSRLHQRRCWNVKGLATNTSAVDPTIHVQHITRSLIYPFPDQLFLDSKRSAFDGAKYINKLCTTRLLSIDSGTCSKSRSNPSLLPSSQRASSTHPRAYIPQATVPHWSLFQERLTMAPVSKSEGGRAKQNL